MEHLRPEQIAQAGRALMDWYDQNARMLPWRDSKDPYRIWVSEIMLQQTQVRTALPYYERFVVTLPDVEALAAADDAVLLKLWEGLGYYSRVRNMQKAARIIADDYGGRMPEAFDQLLKLPGIGEYSAGAIASIAFGQAVPAVDGNVLRVYSRLLGSRRQLGEPGVKKDFRQLALQMQDADRPGDFNQALMELGATVCMPNGAPLCGACPWEGFCRARLDGTTGQIPVKAAKQKKRVEERTILLVASDRGLLLQRRPDDGLLAGMAEPLNFEGRLSPEDLTGALRDAGLQLDALDSLGKARHIFSHIEWHMEGYLAVVKTGNAPEGTFWAAQSELAGTVAVPAAFKAFLARLRGRSPQQDTSGGTHEEKDI